MCAAAHGWVGLGRIVYASSSAQLVEWLSEWGLPPSRVKNLAIQDVIRDTAVDGPVPELADEIKILHERHHHNRRLLTD
jgi:tRNA(Arg) A34 adenosine deaminase TadA